MQVNGIPIVDKPSSASGSGITIAENFDTFLRLLTTQLQNQDPLSPLDTTEFTNQLTNFAQVEQGINTNKKLDQLISLQGGSQLSAGVSYMGKQIEAPGEVMLLQDGRGRIGYELPRSSARTTIAILNSNNNVVAFFEGSTQAGKHVLEWDGTDDSGNKLPDGSYRALVTALDADNQTMKSSMTSFGRVTGVELENGKVTLVMDSLSVNLEDVVSVHELPASSNQDA
ncbi:MAG: flagellar hook assembly protein FlgD [Kiloniellales bacterium]